MSGGRAMSKKRSLTPTWPPYLFIAPFVLLFVVFTLYPLLYSVVMAMQQNNGPKVCAFVGLDNFRWLYDDPEFWKALRNTFVFRRRVDLYPVALRRWAWRSCSIGRRSRPAGSSD